MNKMFPYRICYVEDSPLIADPMGLGMEVLLDAEVNLFSTTNGALRTIEQQGFSNWQVYVIDNRTGHGMMSGIELAQQIREKAPEAIVVSLNSSDVQEIIDFGLEKLKKLRIEFWYKHTESFLMIPWLADCAKAEQMIPRAEWLESIGETTNYLRPDLDRPREPEKRLMFMCKAFEQGTIDPELIGILMKRDVKEYLEELTEGRRRKIERE